MSGILKRKRAGEGSNLSVSSVTSHDLSANDVRASLELTLVELRASTERIQTLLASGATGSDRAERSALRELDVAPQTVSSPLESPRVTDKACSSCRELREELSTLRAQVVQHAGEKEAWKAFKVWWLGSLEKRERKRSQKRTKAGSSPLGKEEGREDERVQRLVRKLDDPTRDVWVRAGIVPPDVDQGGTGGREAEGSRSREEESEAALPLHSTARQGLERDVLGSAGTWNALQTPAEMQQSRQATLDHAQPIHRPAAQGLEHDVLGSAGTSNVLQRPAEMQQTRQATLDHPQPIHRPTTRTPRSETTNRPGSSVITSRSNTTPRTHPAPRPPHPPATTTTTPAPAPAAYIDDTPIRNAHQRRTLHASDCPDCSIFYSHLNQIPSLGSARQGDTERSACSRHRSTFARAQTPEGYWNIGFPSTQEVELINAAARHGRPPPAPGAERPR